MMNRRSFLAVSATPGLDSAFGQTSPSANVPKDAPLLKVGLIGKDGHTNVVLDGMLHLPGVQLTAIARARPQDDMRGIQRHKAFLPSTKIFDDYRQMLDQARPDLVGICLPYAENGRAAIEAIQRGIHIVSEKPAAATIEELDRLEAALKTGRASYTMMLTMRSSPRFHAARQAIQQGWIGEPILITGQKSYKFGPSRPWFYKERNLYGGTIPWVGIHALDFMQFVSGQEYARVIALQGNKAHPAWPGCEDYAGTLFQMKNGGTAICHMDFLRPESAPTHGDDRLRIAGSDGVLEVLETEEKIILHSSKNVSMPQELPVVPDLFGSFVRSIRGEGVPLVTSQEALKITRICLKAREAAEKGTWIDIV